MVRNVEPCTAAVGFWHGCSGGSKTSAPELREQQVGAHVHEALLLYRFPQSCGLWQRIFTSVIVIVIGVPWLLPFATGFPLLTMQLLLLILLMLLQQLLIMQTADLIVAESGLPISEGPQLLALAPAHAPGSDPPALLALVAMPSSQ
jgi:hypothetical protein